MLLTSYPVINVKLGIDNLLYSSFNILLQTCGFQQRICQRERACGEEAGVPEASEAATDRARADWLPGVDLQSR